ncbi:MAG: Small-conductance mechanosensitive channel MscMJ [Candidatus Methanofastidiosum methylothiophilum]|uniref:Small-conductance mechanosensitive channel MscMJ n=1 Tax=Candidatus Methanofastidiosum methylothiophilum TaxID=1705564 RepID=A0A150ILJ0_9EURY|nr:MAG: Small-conductance mechanosensitive channel MscMJ [Candidatus Methanofastidiosum methylthiophilus]KYC47936.1 MAG: Small-conductance mechanosensitive channel MscMJ [Candidatus Methanofastidiosum methylthiophilus]KYC50554.1 MAG: Small-conductance mechanosensitive channel MscMJ [Candidatus Methanofastidiosum methylthiophilus]
MNLDEILGTLSKTIGIIETDRIFPYLFALGMIIFSIVLAKGLSMLLKRYLRDKFDKDRLGILLKGSYYGIIILAVILALPILGINTSGLLVAGGVTGIVIGFASQSIVGNLISGLFIMAERPIKIGSQVEIDKIKGFVEDIGIMSTILRSYDGLYIRIPNEKVFTNNITNISVNIARRIEYTIGIRYSDDANKAIKIISDLIEDHPFVLKKPTPDIYVDALGESSVNIIVKAWAPVTQWYATKKELLWKIKTNLEKEDIHVPFPQRVVWFANEKSDNNDLN